MRSVARSVIVAAGLLAQLSSSGCTVGPAYRAPETRLAPFHSGVGRSAAGGAHADAAAQGPQLDVWWKGFNDPLLSELVEKARSQNLDLAAALARVRQARAAAREAGAQLLPSAYLNAQGAQIRQSLQSPIGQLGSAQPGFDRNQSLYDLNLGASWELDLFGGLRRGRQAATAEAAAAIAAQVGTRISVTADTADAYLRIRGDQARLVAVHGQIDADQQLLSLVRQRFSHGLASVRETSQSEALLSQAQAQLQPLQVDLEAQLNRLDVLLGEQPGSNAAQLRAPGDIPTAPLVPTNDRPVDVLRRRPDVIAAERQVAAASARIGQAVAGYYPEISVSGLLGYEASRPAELFKAATFQPEGVAGLRWRIFDFGRVGAEVAQARGAEAEALAVYRQTVLRAAGDVENAFTTLVQLRAHQRELENEVAALERARDAAQESYTAGLDALIDVLDANRQLLAAQDELAGTRADVARAAVGSFRALGGGW